MAGHVHRSALWKAIAVAALPSVAAMTTGCREQAAAAANPVTPVRVSAVATYTAASRTPYSAVIVPYAQVDLAFKSGGYVDSIHQMKGHDGRTRNVQEGDWVTEGTVLATVRRADYAAAVNQANAQVAQARASLDQATLDYERTDALFRQESVTKPQYDAAKAKLDSATAGLRGAESAVSQAETALDDCALKAPMSGWVLKRNVEVGTLVGASMPGFSLADTRLVKAVFGVPDLVVASIKLGQPQTIAMQAMPGPFTGRITAIAPAADSKTRTFSIEVTIANPGNQLRPGMIASLALSGAEAKKPVVVIPVSAVVRAPGAAEGFGLFVVEDRGGQTIAHARAVELGATFGNLIAIERGVNVGDRVIVSGADFVRDGQPVRIVP